jgi:hypothetical protein
MLRQRTLSNLPLKDLSSGKEESWLYKKKEPIGAFKNKGGKGRASAFKIGG